MTIDDLESELTTLRDPSAPDRARRLRAARREVERMRLPQSTPGGSIAAERHRRRVYFLSARLDGLQDVGAGGRREGAR